MPETRHTCPLGRSRALPPTFAFVIIVLVIIDRSEQAHNLLLFSPPDILVQGRIYCILFRSVPPQFFCFRDQLIVNRQIGSHASPHTHCYTCRCVESTCSP